MLAYKNGITKAQFVKEMLRHKELDNFISGTYGQGQDTKACAVGCGIQSLVKLNKLYPGTSEVSYSDHKKLGDALGVPEWLERVQDIIFEGLRGPKQKNWPVQFAKAINSGADLEKAKLPFTLFILRDSLSSMDKVKFDKEKFPDVVRAIEGSKEAVSQVITAFRKKQGLSAAHSVARSAASAARSAASAADSAASAAYSAADSAASAARSAASAARSAASAADSADSAAYSAARSAAYSAAYSAASAAYSAASAARSAASAARSAASAAYSTAYSAAYSATDSAASAARSAASAADSAASAAYSAAHDRYAKQLLKILKGIKPPKPNRHRA